MRIYVLGRGGQVARALREVVKEEKDIVLETAGRPEVDLLNPDSIRRAMDSFRPALVINAAAFTSVDGAETEADMAFAVNRDGARVVASAAAALGVPVIHFSSDYVFDGTKEGWYREGDAVNPLNVYGRSKLEGELAVAAANPRHVILRTSWVYAPYGSNFVRSIVSLAMRQDNLHVVHDQVGCPTYAPDIAKAAIAVARRLIGVEWTADMGGVVHLAGPDGMSWYTFAKKIVDETGRSDGHKVIVHPISTSANRPARRPANSRLSSVRAEAIFGVKLPSLSLSLATCMARIRCANVGEGS